MSELGKPLLQHEDVELGEPSPQAKPSCKAFLLIVARCFWWVLQMAFILSCVHLIFALLFYLCINALFKR